MPRITRAVYRAYVFFMLLNQGFLDQKGFAEENWFCNDWTGFCSMFDVTVERFPRGTLFFSLFLCPAVASFFRIDVDAVSLNPGSGLK